jgi:hypothetical protein
MKLILLLMPVLLFIGCTKETYNLNNEFTLDFNETATVIVDGEKWEIKFIELLEESRCPPDVFCFWAGQVAVKIEINKEINANIGLHTTIPQAYQYKNRLITLLSVEFDKDKNYGKKKHYSIKLRVD